MDLVETVLQELRKQITKEEHLEENPLAVIGLSPGILNLGLNADELWGYCRTTSRFLVSSFHPDRKMDLGIEEYQRRYAEAFELLKDREVFNRALKEFELQTRDERSELSHLRRINKDLSERYKEEVLNVRSALSRNREKQLETEIELKTLKTNYRQFLSSFGPNVNKPYRVHSGAITNSAVASCSHLLLINISWHRDSSILRKSDDVDVESLIEEAISSKEILPTAIKQNSILKEHRESDIKEEYRLAGFSDNWLSTEYRHGLEMVRNFLVAGGISFVDGLVIEPVLRIVYNGSLIDPHDPDSRKTIIGSADIAEIIRGVKESTLSDRSGNGINPDIILPHISPSIKKGDFLIYRELEGKGIKEAKFIVAYIVAIDDERHRSRR